MGLKTVERVLREAGAKRVSKEASAEFAEYLEKFTRVIAKDALELAEHSGRKTVTERDILLARKRLKP